MSMLDAELDNIPLEASRGISALLQGQLDDCDEKFRF
jgi:hypothetical protein